MSALKTLENFFGAVREWLIQTKPPINSDRPTDHSMYYSVKSTDDITISIEM